MTKRTTFTKADLARAVSVADQLGKVALWTPQGIAFVESDQVALSLPELAEPSAYDAWKATREGQRAGRS